MAYSEKEKTKIVNEICDLMETGVSLRKACTKLSIPRSSFYDIVDNDEKKMYQYARAMEARADHMFEDILHIADDTTSDQETVNIDGIELTNTNHDVIQRSRLRVDSRKWILSKMIPKKYGDKSTLALEGGEKPIEISFED